MADREGHRDSEREGRGEDTQAQSLLKECSLLRAIHHDLGCPSTGLATGLLDFGTEVLCSKGADLGE